MPHKGVWVLWPKRAWHAERDLSSHRVIFLWNPHIYCVRDCVTWQCLRDLLYCVYLIGISTRLWTQIQCTVNEIMLTRIQCHTVYILYMMRMCTHVLIHPMRHLRYVIICDIMWVYAHAWWACVIWIGIGECQFRKWHCASEKSGTVYHHTPMIVIIRNIRLHPYYRKEREEINLPCATLSTVTTLLKILPSV